MSVSGYVFSLLSVQCFWMWLPLALGCFCFGFSVKVLLLVKFEVFILILSPIYSAQGSVLMGTINNILNVSMDWI